MARLPQPGGDANAWGEILNDFLTAAHNTDGTLKGGVVNTTALAAGSPTTGQVLGYNGSELSWSTPSASGSVPDATSSVKGLVQLTGDLAGSAAAPTVPGLAAKADTTAVTAHTSNVANPHSVTKAQVGLGNADNTSDVSKPVSTAVQTALNLKASLASPTFTGSVVIPTPTTGTQAANKSYVDSAVSAGGGGGGAPILVAQSGDYAANANEFIVGNASTNSFTVTLPAAVTGIKVSVKKVDSSANGILVVPASGLIDNLASDVVNNQWQSQDYLSDGVKWYRI